MANDSFKMWLSLLFIKDKSKPQLVSDAWATGRLKLKISTLGKNEQPGYRPTQENCQVASIKLNMHTPEDTVIPFFSLHPEETYQVYQKMGIWEPRFLISKHRKPSTYHQYPGESSQCLSLDLGTILCAHFQKLHQAAHFHQGYFHSTHFPVPSFS